MQRVGAEHLVGLRGVPAVRVTPLRPADDPVAVIDHDRMDLADPDGPAAVAGFGVGIAAGFHPADRVPGAEQLDLSPEMWIADEQGNE